MQDRFGVAARRVAVALRLEDGAKRRMVVNFAVVSDPQRAVFVGHRLMAAGEIDDREAAVAEADRTIDPGAGAVGSAMAQGVAHPLKPRFVDLPVWSQLDDADNPAHGIR